METKLKIKLLAAGGALVLAGIIIFLLTVFFSPSSLTVTVVDEHAGTAVWDSTITIQDRVINGRYDTKYRFSDLKTGDYELVVTAPNYPGKRIPVSIVPGPNVLPEPVKMAGTAIPDFYYFHMEEKKDAEGVGVLFVPINDKGDFIEHFPGVDVVVAVRISEQWKDGAPITAPVQKGSERGPSLFSGIVPWKAIDIDGASFKYYVEVEPKSIKYTDAGFYVVDCLVLMPDYEKITRDAVNQIIEGVGSISEKKELAAYLKQYEDKVKYSYQALWNVKNVSNRKAPEAVTKGGKS